VTHGEPSVISAPQGQWLRRAAWMTLEEKAIAR